MNNGFHFPQPDGTTREWSGIVCELFNHARVMEETSRGLPNVMAIHAAMTAGFELAIAMNLENPEWFAEHATRFFTAGGEEAVRDMARDAMTHVQSHIDGTDLMSRIGEALRG